MGEEIRTRSTRLQRRTTRFNGAAPSWARRFVRQRRCARRRRSFNGAAPSWARRLSAGRTFPFGSKALQRSRTQLGAEILVFMVTQFQVCYRFNGAAPSWARRSFTHAITASFPAGLQRSRTQLGAEIGRRWSESALPHLASTEPHPVGRGDAGLLFQTGFDGRASTEPHPVGRGDVFRRPSDRRRPRGASTEPHPVGRGDYRGEFTPVSGLPCFNGAAPSWARRSSLKSG